MEVLVESAVQKALLIEQGMDVILIAEVFILYCKQQH